MIRVKNNKKLLKLFCEVFEPIPKTGNNVEQGQTDGGNELKKQ